MECTLRLLHIIFKIIVINLIRVLKINPLLRNLFISIFAQSVENKKENWLGFNIQFVTCNLLQFFFWITFIQQISLNLFLIHIICQKVYSIYYIKCYKILSLLHIINTHNSTLWMRWDEQQNIFHAKTTVKNAIEFANIIVKQQGKMKILCCHTVELLQLIKNCLIAKRFEFEFFLYSKIKSKLNYSCIEIARESAWARKTWAKSIGVGKILWIETLFRKNFLFFCILYIFAPFIGKLWFNL